MNQVSTKRLYEKVLLSPFRYLRPSVRTEAYFIVAVLIPQIIMLFLTKSFDSLLVLTASVCASIVVEFVDFNLKKKNCFTWTVSLLRGIIIGLLLPSTYPIISVFFITFSVLFVNKFILGGFANSWVNPIAMTVAVCWLIGMRYFPSMLVTIDDLQSKNPALSLIRNGTFPMNSFDARITNFLNIKFFNLLGVSIPDGYVSLFWDTKSVIPAFRFNLITLISSIVLIAFDVLSPLVPGLFILTYGVLVRVLAPFFYEGPAFQGDILLALLSSGTLFSMFFILQWHGTVPMMNRGRVLYGIFAGIAAFFIVGVGTSPVGFVFLILILNVMSPLIQTVENKLEQSYTNSVVADNEVDE